ncbi:hypothetical protein [Streptomyces sp. SBT349]|uniref:hypothetical protein n=1 Tax=Streptomyces sp. SBT349 TaxID=1580539 RepID=UPI000A5DDAFA|nr:hypothetical protein [Streptomyces sp. SBT349]
MTVPEEPVPDERPEGDGDPVEDLRTRLAELSKRIDEHFERLEQRPPTGNRRTGLRPTP